MKTAYSYIRFSSKRQVDGDSLRRQTAASEKYCAEKGLVLDTSLNLFDLGVSAWSGEDVAQGNLSVFLKAIEKGIVKPGSTLLVENLDRLSRKSVLKAFKLFTSILESGVKIVTLMDRMEYTEQSMESNIGQLFASLGMMIGNNKYSSNLSERVREAWANKRKVLANGFTKPLTARCPGWVTPIMVSVRGEMVCDHFELHPVNAPVVRRIVKLATEGLGRVAIASILNRENVPSFSLKRKPMKWDCETVRHITNSRLLIGEFQPGKIENGKQIPDGKPIANYYPPVINEKEFNRLQASLASRKTVCVGRQGKSTTNIFGRLLISGHDGSQMRLHKSSDKGNLVIMSASSINGIGKRLSFPYPALEGAFFKWVREVKLIDAKSGNKSEEIRGQIAVANSKIAKLMSTIESSDVSEIDSLSSVVKRLESTKKMLMENLEIEMGKSTGSPAADLQELLKGDSDKAEIRQRIKTAVAGVVHCVKVYIYFQNQVRVCIAHVQMNDGSDRMFAVRWEQGKGWATFSDNLTWKGFTQPDSITAAWCDRIAPDLLAA